LEVFDATPSEIIYLENTNQDLSAQVLVSKKQINLIDVANN